MKMLLMIKKLLLVGEIFFGLILTLVIIVSFIPLVPPFKNYYHSRTVLTGSMEPKIPKGSVVINQWLDQKNLKVGQVITYQHPARKKIIYITHRIVKIDKTGLLWRFETRGDANPVSDFGLVTQVSIEGKVILMIPLIGYLIEFFKTPVGFILLIALPLLIFIVRQTRDVLQIWKKLDILPTPIVEPAIDNKPLAKRKRRKSAKRKIRKTFVVILLALSFLAARTSFVTYASFTSGQATITDVTLSTATSFPGDVVINELMWAGSTVSTADEWIELRNTTGNPINLADWKIDGAGSGSHSITLSGTIPGSDFFLISHYSNDHSAISNSISVDQIIPGISLHNGGEQLTLKDASNNMIDQTPSGSWPQGVNGPPDWKSMERNDTPGDGTSSESWHTCTDSACNDTAYWDSESNNYGTPKAANLSENDPTLPLPSPSPSPEPTVSPEPSPTPSPTPTEEPESTPTRTLTPIPEVSSTPTPSPTTEISPTPAPTSEPTPTLTPTPSPDSEL